MANYDEPLQEDDECFMDEVITFRVENKLFRVPPCRFTQNSPTFARMFGLLQLDGSASSSRDIITMPQDVSIYDFKLLLRLLYPAATPSPQSRSFMTDELVHLAGLLKTWGFDDLLKATLKEIESEPHISVISKTPPAHLVRLGRELSCPAWICSGFMFLVGRTKALTKEEAAIIGEQSAEVVRRLRRKHLARKLVNLEAEIVIEAFPDELNMAAALQSPALAASF